MKPRNPIRKIEAWLGRMAERLEPPAAPKPPQPSSKERLARAIQRGKAAATDSFHHMRSVNQRKETLMNPEMEFKLDYQLSENEDFVPCNTEQLDAIEMLLKQYAHLPATKHKQEDLAEYIQGMRENIAKGWDTSGYSLDGHSLQSYIRFLERHPSHEHRLYVLGTGEILAKWGNEDMLFGQDGAQCTTRGYQKPENCEPLLIQSEWATIEQAPQMFAHLRQRMPNAKGLNQNNAGIA